jgi:hypothetical protein
VQEQDARKNFIDILYDATEEQRVIEALAKSNSFAKEYLRDLAVHLFTRRRKA